MDPRRKLQTIWYRMYLLKEMDDYLSVSCTRSFSVPVFEGSLRTSWNIDMKRVPWNQGSSAEDWKQIRKFLSKLSSHKKRQKPNLKVLTCYLHKGLGSLVPSADISTNRLLPRDCNLEERYCKKLKPRIKLWFVSDFTWPFEVGVFCRFSAEFFVNLEET